MSKITLGKVTVTDLASRDPSVTTEPVLTSPRSLRVCLERGVEPAMLVPKRLADFASSPNVSAATRRARWSRHEQTRCARVVALNKARDVLPEVEQSEVSEVPGVKGAVSLGGAFGRSARAGVSPSRAFSFSGSNQGWDSGLSSPSPYDTTYASTTPPMRRQAFLRPTSAPVNSFSYHGDISAVREEERRVEAARRRTEKQLAVLQTAKATAERIRSVNAAKIAQAKRVDEFREAAMARVERERCEKGFQDLQRSKEDAKRFEERKRKDSEARFQERQAALREQRDKETRERLQQEADEAARERKINDFRKRTEAIAANKRALLSIKDCEMGERERHRILAKELEHQVLTAQAEQRRVRFETRLLSARTKHTHLTEKKRLSITQKTAKAALRKMSAEEAEEISRQEKINKLKEKQQFRDSRYNDGKEMERLRSARYLRKQQEDDEALRNAKARRQSEFEREALERQLSLEEKQEKVEMATRRKQYKASLLLEKIERETHRAKALNSARQELAQQRRLHNDDLSLERTLLMRADPREIRRVQSFKAKHSGRPQSARPASALRSPYASPYANLMSPDTPRGVQEESEFF